MPHLQENYQIRKIIIIVKDGDKSKKIELLDDYDCTSFTLYQLRYLVEYRLDKLLKDGQSLTILGMETDHEHTRDGTHISHEKFLNACFTGEAYKKGNNKWIN